MRRAFLAVALILAGAWVAGGEAWAGRAMVDWQERFVNVRAAPDLSARKVGRLARGAEAEVLEERGEWVRVRHAGGEGWVVDRSLRRLPEPPAPVAAAETPAPAAASAAGSPPPQPEPPPPASSPPPPPPSSPAPQPGERGGYLADLEEPRLPSYEPGSGLVSLFSGLLLVLALLAGLVWLARRLSGGRLLPGGRRASPIHVLATRPVGPRQGLLLVEVAGSVWLLSQGPEGLRLVAEVRDEAALARLNGQYGFRETPFESTLRTRLDLESGEAGGAAEPAGGAAPAEAGVPSPEERLAALRRRPPAGGPS